MSINIGLSGLRATSEQINTISHNIANVDTIGYKSSRTEFQDVYAPSLAAVKWAVWKCLISVRTLSVVQP